MIGGGFAKPELDLRIGLCNFGCCLFSLSVFFFLFEDSQPPPFPFPISTLFWNALDVHTPRMLGIKRGINVEAGSFVSQFCGFPGLTFLDTAAPRAVREGFLRLYTCLLVNIDDGGTTLSENDLVEDDERVDDD